MSEEVRKTAALARLEIDDEEAARLGAQFERTLAHFEVLATLDVDGLEELTAPPRPAGQLRADVERPSLPRERVLDGAPDPRGEFFGVPKTVIRPDAPGAGAAGEAP